MTSGTPTAGTDQSPLGSISPKAVREATGRDWNDWLETLDAAGASEWNHREIVAYLARAHGTATSPWWRQSITVGYERARGKRVLGQTAQAGFEVGVQRTVPITVTEAWLLVTSRPELWLGTGASVVFEEGARYDVPASHAAASATGEVRVVKPEQRVRMTWQPDGWPAAATVQLTLERLRSGKTVIHVHLEKLPDADTREAMRTRWREALDRIAAAAG